MNIQELATAVNYNIPVKVAILNNGYLGMVRQWQQLFYNSRYSQVDLKGTPDFVELAQAYGAERGSNQLAWSLAAKAPGQRIRTPRLRESSLPYLLANQDG